MSNLQASRDNECQLARVCVKIIYYIIYAVERDSNQRPRDYRNSHYSPPLYQLSYSECVLYIYVRLARTG